MKKKLLHPILTVFVIILVAGYVNAQPIIADHSVISDFDSIPDSVVNSITNSFNIYYVHTSHGSQIMTGISLVEDDNPLYEPPPFHEVSDDLGHNGDTSWVPPTRAYLDSHPECNMAMFSWCGGVSDNTEEGINIYLNKMDELEQDYPDVIFIYMTGHLDGTGPDGNLYQRNNQIRDYCTDNDKILFDFADIESYDPDGNYYPWGSDACEWCYDWCDDNPCPSCGCAHSHCFNCYQKGKTWWWMMAAISGWNAQTDLSVNMIPDNPPITVPAGGSFTYTGILTNNTDVSQITDVWVMLDVPNYGSYGPVKTYNDITLEPNQTITSMGITQYVPLYAPLGDYSYIAYCGDYPSIITDESSFPFTVTERNLSGASGWDLSDWFNTARSDNENKSAIITNYPNPFNASVNFAISLNSESSVKLEIYNLMGQKVAFLASGVIESGNHNIIWNASDLPSGIYFYKFTNDNSSITGRMSLLK